MNPQIPMVDPAAEYRMLKQDIDAAVGRVLASGRYVLGPEGEALEGELAAYVGAPHASAATPAPTRCIFRSSPSASGPGDEVVVPAFTFFATAEAVSYTGATPVFADIDPAASTSSGFSEGNVSAKTRAVIAVHLFGQCAALEEIAEICRERTLVLIEDCAQAIGADYDGRRAGSGATSAAFRSIRRRTSARSAMPA